MSSCRPRRRRSIDRYRDLVQALLVRRLLWERVSSGQIAVVVSGRGTEETERISLGGIEVVAMAGGERCGWDTPASGTVYTWRRVQVASGVELNIRDYLPKLGATELKELLARIEELRHRGF